MKFVLDTRQSYTRFKIISFVLKTILPHCRECGILVAHPGNEPSPPALKMKSLTTVLPGNSPVEFLCGNKSNCIFCLTVCISVSKILVGRLIHCVSMKTYKVSSESARNSYSKVSIVNYHKCFLRKHFIVFIFFK